MPYLYRHIRIDKNEPFYVGIGSDTDYRRASIVNGRNIFWKRIANKTKYEIEIMLDDLTWEEACKKEMEFIKLYGRSDLGLGTLTNLTNGGEGQLNPSVETRIKLQYIKSKEHREKLSKAKIGNKHPFYNKSRETHKNWMIENHPNKKPIFQYDLENNLIKEWVSASEAHNALGIDYRNISACCREKRKTAGGYIWKFIK